MNDAHMRTLDAAVLPSYGFGHRSLMWWGTMGMVAIEGMAFVLATGMYLYLWSQAEAWPQSAAPPDLRWGTLNLIVLLLSSLPNHWTKKAAEGHDLRKVRIGMVICLGFGLVFLLIRALEFTTLNCRWDDNAYGSVVWFLLGLHTFHLLTDFYDSAVLTALMFTGPLEGRRFLDVSENAVYWYFVVLAWAPLYAIIYWAPRIG